MVVFSWPSYLVKIFGATYQSSSVLAIFPIKDAAETLFVISALLPNSLHTIFQAVLKFVTPFRITLLTPSRWEVVISIGYPHMVVVTVDEATSLAVEEREGLHERHGDRPGTASVG